MPKTQIDRSYSVCNDIELYVLKRLQETLNSLNKVLISNRPTMTNKLYSNNAIYVRNDVKLKRTPKHQLHAQRQ